VIVLVASPLIAFGRAEPASLCQKLAARVRQSLPTTTESALLAGIVTAQPADLGRWGPSERKANALLRAVMESQGVLPKSRTAPGPIMELVHLPDSPLYMGSVVAGTAECQQAAFAALSADGSVRAIPEPPGYTGACWNLIGSLARVLGHPAYVESGKLSATSDDAVMRVTPWTGHRWADPCQLTVEFTYSLQLARQFCGESQSCRAASAIALDIAREYLDYSGMRKPPERRIDGGVIPDFSSAAGGASGPPAQTAVNAGWQVLKRQQQAAIPGVSPTYGTMASVFPTFGHESPNGGWDYSFSYVSFVLFPVVLDGRLYLAAVGHNGVGWREGTNILFAVYASPDADQHDLVPLAGLLIERKPNGLKGTVVAEGMSAVPARR
jgi:hypothetical protein